MPELPEVETVKNGIKQILGLGDKKNLAIVGVDIRRKNLREPFPRNLEKNLIGQDLLDIHRRAKYLLFQFSQGYLINHLGMTGSWRRLESKRFEKHDHFALSFASGVVLVFNDPRRFGLVTWSKKLEDYSRLAMLGPEPLSDDFSAEHLLEALKGRNGSVKAMLMSQNIVVGIGNIYASEVLFRAGVRPQRPGARVTRAECEKIVVESKKVLAEAISAGGSTISDFRQAGGESGYFQHNFMVYGRSGEACLRCRTAIKGIMLAGRNSFFCSFCQQR